jgi:hypothetical protein
MLSAALCRLLTSCPVIEPPPACEYLCSSTFLPQYHPLCSKTLSSYNWRLPNYKGMNKLWDRCSSIRVTAPCYQKSVCYSVPLLLSLLHQTHLFVLDIITTRCQQRKEDTRETSFFLADLRYCSLFWDQIHVSTLIWTCVLDHTPEEL